MDRVGGWKGGCGPHVWLSGWLNDIDELVLMAAGVCEPDTVESLP
jgi:hypothetical protein